MTNEHYGNDRRPRGEQTGSTRYSKYSAGDGGASDGGYDGAGYDEAGYDGAGYDEPLDAEIVEDDRAADLYASDRATDRYADGAATDPGYRGAHRRDDDAEYDDADHTEYLDRDYRDDRDGAAAVAGSERVAAGEAGAAGGSSAAGAAEGGLPKRGLAMILIAVAALLALWGIWKMTQNGDDDNAAAPTSATLSASAPASAPAAPAAPAGQQDPAAQGSAAQGSAAQGSPAQNTAAPAGQGAGQGAGTPNSAAPSTAAQDPANQSAAPNAQNGQQGQPAPAGAPIDNSSAQVFVYNNSGVPDLASRTADQLKGQYNVVNNSPDSAVMNMPEQQYGVFDGTYVFYDPSVPGAEKVATDLARRVGGTARVKGDIPQGAVSLPEQAAKDRSAVAVVLAG